jgi:hypothetical protein
MICLDLEELMGLTDDPVYKRLTEGDDTEVLVGTLSMPSPDGSGLITLSLFLIDYKEEDIDRFVNDLFKDLKKMDLVVREGTYTLSIEEQSTTLMFAEGETASHTAPNFWAQYVPQPEEHEAFQRELARTGVWLLIILTTKNLREFVVRQDGTVIFSRVNPMTATIRKMFKF